MKLRDRARGALGQIAKLVPGLSGPKRVSPLDALANGLPVTSPIQSGPSWYDPSKPNQGIQWGPFNPDRPGPGPQTSEWRQGRDDCVEVFQPQDAPNGVLAAPLGLVFDSGTVSVKPVIEATFATQSSDPLPSSVEFRLTADGTAQSWKTFATTGLSAGDTLAMADQVAAARSSTGAFPFTIEVVAHFSGRGDVRRTVSGTASAVVRDATEFGAGWGLAGLDRVVTGTGTAMYVHGAGSSRLFTGSGGTYTRPANEFGTLAQNGDGTFTYTTPQQLQRQFDTGGRLTKVVDRHGQTVSYSYDGGGLLTKIQDPDGRVTSFSYASGKLSAVELVGGRRVTFTYTGSDLTRIDYPDGGARTFAYDAAHRLTGEEWGPRRTTYAYDSSTGMLKSIDRGLNSVTTLTLAAAARGLGTTAVRSDAPAVVTDALGQKTSLTLDRLGRVLKAQTPDGATQTWQRDASGLVTAYTDALGRTTSYAYTAGTDDLIRITRPDATAVTITYSSTYHLPTSYEDSLNRVTTLELTAQGDVERLTDPLNRTTTFTWQNGLLRGATDALNHTTTYQYDANRRLEAVVDAQDGRTTFGYDASWNLQTVKDALGRVTTRAYDPMRRLTQVVTPDTASTTFAYNAPGWQTGMTDALGRRTELRYDMRGYMTELAEAVGTADERTTTLAYDVLGRVTRHTDALNRVTSFGYDPVGRVRTVTDALNGVATYAYDLAGQLRGATDALGHTATYTYDRRARVIEGTDALGRTAVSQYDAEDNVTRSAVPRELTALGEFEPHTTTYSDQHYPAAAADAVGNFVVVWQSSGQDGSGWGIYGQRYSAAGTRIGNEFRVNIHTTGDQTAPAIAMAPGGAFVVVWTSAGQDGSETGIYAQRFSAAGVAQDTVDLRVNTTTASYQLHPAVSAGEDGRFVVAWMSYLQDSSGYGIFAQRYNAAGAAEGGETPINTTTSDHQWYPTVAVGADGGFLIAWQGQEQDGDAAGVFARRYSAAGVAQGGELQINTSTVANQMVPASASVAPDGSFVVAWQSNSTGDYDVIARVYDAAGVALTGEVIANTTRTGYQGNVAVAMAPGGGFLAAWESVGQDGSGSGVYAQRFGHAGVRAGGEFRVNSFTDGDQWATKVGADGLGNYVVAWMSAGHDGSGLGVVGQRYSGATVTSFAYDALDRATRAAQAFGLPEQRTSTVAFDEVGRVLSFTAPQVGTTSYGYDTLNRATRLIEAFDTSLQRTTTFAYDKVGNVLSITDPRVITTSFAYDGRDRISRTIEAWGNALQRTTTVAYDARGNVLSVTDPRNVSVSYAYDGLDRPTRIVDAQGDTLQRTTTVNYDKVDNLVETIDPLGRRTTVTYDALNRATILTDSLSQRTTTIYDKVGNVLSVTDPRSVTGSFAYDVLDRTSRVVEALGDALQRTTTLGYDWGGWLNDIADPLGRRTTVAHDAFGRQSIVIDALGQRTTLAYDVRGLLLSVTDPLGIATSFAYDALGRTTRVLEAYGTSLVRTTTFAYTTGDELLSTTDPRGTVTSYAYDALGRTARVIEAFGHVLQRTTTLAYTEHDQILSSTNPRNITTSFAYDALGRVTRAIEAMGLPEQQTTTAVYDAADRVLSLIDARGVTTSFAYDALDRLTRAIQAYGDPLQRTTTFAYDAVGHLLAQTNPRGYTTSVAYDALGRPAEVRDARNGLATVVYDAADRVVALVDPLGHRTTLAYDALDRVRTLTNALNKTSTFAYDAGGNLLTATDARNYTVTYQYDALGRRTVTIDALTQRTTMEYDVGGLLTGLVNARGHRGTLTYDSLGRLSTQTDSLNHVTSFGYDAADNLTRITDALGHTTTFAFDVLDRQVSAQSPSGAVATTVYDAAGLLLATVNGLGKRTTFSHDALGRRTQVQDARGGLVTLAYDANDNLTSLTDPVGNRTTFAYDELDRRDRMTDPRNKAATYSYDTASRLTSRTDRLGRRIDFAYDDADRPTGQTWYTAAGAVAERVTYAYDAVGNQTAAANGTGAYTLAYDELNRVKSVQEPFGLSLTFAYDAAGNRTRVEDSLGGVLTSSYDAANRLSYRQFSGNGGQLRITYGYTVRDELAQIIRYSDAAGLTQVGETTLAYDPAGRTEVIKHRDGAGTWFQTTTYSYDLADRMTAEARNGTPVTYTYDATDQLTADAAKTYGYDLGGNRNTTGYATDSANRMTSDGTWNFQYDDEGNQTQRTTISDNSYWTYEYDHVNRLTAAKQYNSGGILQKEVTYKYDAWGNRVERAEDPDGTGSQGTTTERYGLDGWKTRQDFWGNAQTLIGLENFDAWADLDGSNALKTRRIYSDGGDEPEARVNSTGVTAWYHRDVRHSITAMTDSYGTVQSQVTYDGFGNVTANSGAAFSDRYLYTSREVDPATGLAYHRARWYDPATGRWTAQDPAGFGAADTNLYRYVGNEPTGALDPSGLARQAMAPTEASAPCGCGTTGKAASEIDKEVDRLVKNMCAAAGNAALAHQFFANQYRDLNPFVGGFNPLFRDPTLADPANTARLKELIRERIRQFVSAHMGGIGGSPEHEQQLVNVIWKWWIDQYRGTFEPHTVSIRPVSEAEAARRQRLNEFLKRMRNPRSEQEATWLYSEWLKLNGITGAQHFFFPGGGLDCFSACAPGLGAVSRARFDSRAARWDRLSVLRNPLLGPSGEKNCITFDKAHEARDRALAEIARLTRSQQREISTVVGAVNRRTGKTAVGIKRSGQDYGKCAEDLAAEQLGGHPADILFSTTIRPATGKVIPVCPRCQGKYFREQFPPGTVFDPMPMEP